MNEGSRVSPEAYLSDREPKVELVKSVDSVTKQEQTALRELADSGIAPELLAELKDVDLENPSDHEVALGRLNEEAKKVLEQSNDNDGLNPLRRWYAKNRGVILPVSVAAAILGSVSGMVGGVVNVLESVGAEMVQLEKGAEADLDITVARGDPLLYKYVNDRKQGHPEIRGIHLISSKPVGVVIGRGITMNLLMPGSTTVRAVHEALVMLTTQNGDSIVVTGKVTGSEIPNEVISGFLKSHPEINLESITPGQLEALQPQITGALPTIIPPNESAYCRGEAIKDALVSYTNQTVSLGQ
jgi:hypothetical protein